MEVLIVMAFIFLFIMTMIFVLGPMPGRIARKRSHPQAKAIRTCGWVSILSSSPTAWVLCMKWAYQDSPDTTNDLASQITALAKKEKRRRNLFSSNFRQR